MKSPVSYWPQLPLLSAALQPAEPLTVERLVAEAPWVEQTGARKEAFWSTLKQPYSYGQGRGVRTYHPSPFPDWMLPIKQLVEIVSGHAFQLCFLNRYDNQFQHLGWHSDDSPEQDMDAPIAVQSYGAEREIWFRPIGGTLDQVEKLLLKNGSVMIMEPGMQQTHVHRIPKHDKPCGVRVSLTWRALK